jgi:hypothetical protein
MNVMTLIIWSVLPVFHVYILASIVTVQQNAIPVDLVQLKEMHHQDAPAKYNIPNTINNVSTVFHHVKHVQHWILIHVLDVFQDSI